MRKLSVLAAVAALALSVVALGPARAADDPLAGARVLRLDMSGWLDQTTPAMPMAFAGPEQAVGVGPGTFLIINGIDGDDGTYGCTANYLWESGGTRYLGAAGHCFLREDATSSHGDGADASVEGVNVRACVAGCSFGGLLGGAFGGETVALGEVVYARQTQDGADLGNDFGLVEIPEGVPVRTTMPVFGGPDRVGEIAFGDTVCHYGNGVVFGEVWPTMGRAGVGVETVHEQGWWMAELAALFGDSGSAVQVCTLGPDGIVGTAAAGILTHGVGGFVAGTTMPRAMQMTLDDLEVEIAPVLGEPTVIEAADDTPPAEESSDGSTATVTVEAGGSRVTVRV